LRERPGEGTFIKTTMKTKQQINRAKLLRKNSTDAERLLWGKLRNNQLGVKFRRQEPIGKYIVDFVCFEKKIIIEVDGGQHNENVRDKNRDDWLYKNGFRILRFWNSDVLKDTEGVLAQILKEIKG